MFISIHIPKTAGTSLALLFDYGSGRRVFYDYRPDYSNARMNDLEWWLRHKEFLERQFDFIHGHFFYEKYRELFPDAEYLTCLRHPVARIVSQYKHVLAEASADDWQYRAICEHGLDAVDFASLDGIADAQSRHLAGRPVEQYFVFITEWLDVSFSSFQHHFRFKRADPYMLGTDSGSTVPRLNVHTSTATVTQSMQERIFEIAAEDVDVYIRGCERSNALIAAAGLTRR